MKLVCAALTALVSFTTAMAHAADQRTTALLHQALDAQGGEEKLRALKSVQWEAAGYRSMVEQSERPEGPYVTQFFTTSEIHDFQHDRYRSDTESSVYPTWKFNTSSAFSGGVVMLGTGDRSTAGNPEVARQIRERMALEPERLLVTAFDAPDVHAEPDTILQSVPQNVVAFTLDDAPVRIYLNAYTHLPTAVDYSGQLAQTGAASFRGEATMRTWYTFWWLAKGGVHLPLQWNTEKYGLPDQMYVIKKLQMDAPIEEAKFAIPDKIREQYRKASSLSVEQVPLVTDSAKDLAPGIVFIPGSWNVTIIRQQDGVVILEAPISSGYSARVIADAHKRFPGVPIKGVITTSDSWPHLAGIWEYIAQGIPVYALDLNQPMVERIIADAHKTVPDALDKSPHTPDLHLISGKAILGEGPNRIELYPLRGETSERQMMVYFPERHLLYGSDSFQQDQNGAYIFPQAVTEVVDAVSREHLQVDQFFMMHIGPTPWSDLAKAIAAAEAEDTPNGVL
jgi:hypothetical protein